MSENREPDYLYMTSAGRKTGNPHQIEIWFVEHGSSYYLVNENGQSDWLRNIIVTPTVTFSIGSRTAPPISGSARVVDPAAEPELAQTVTALMKRKYQWGEGTIVEIKPTA